MSQKKYPLKPPFIERMKILLPDKKDFQSYLKILKEQPVRSIRCNTLKISSSDLKKKLEEKGWKIKQPWKNYPEVMIVEGKCINNKDNPKINLNKDIEKDSCSSIKNIDSIRAKREKLGVAVGDVVDLEPGELGRSLEHLLGYYYIQELASMLPIIALKPETNNTFLDLCASPGSKTTQAASAMQNTGIIIANEVSLGRIKILASNLERCGCTNAIITRKDGIAFCQRIKRFMRLPSEASKEVAIQRLEESRRKPMGCLQLDKILIDAPCSGEGTLRSSPKTYQMWNPKTIQNLSKLQKLMVASAIEILKPNGTLVYSTCTHAPEENEEVVDFILKEFKGKIKIESIKLPIKCRQGITEWDTTIKNYNDNNINMSSRANRVGRVKRDLGGEENVERKEKIKKFSKEVEKSCRIYPQDNNTEGFFIAKFRRLK